MAGGERGTMDGVRRSMVNKALTEEDAGDSGAKFLYVEKSFNSLRDILIL